MTRTTRSTTSQQQQNEKEKLQTETPKSAGAKKRKRTSVADHVEQPAHKVVRTQDDVKMEDSPEPVDTPDEEAVNGAELPSSGDVPLQPEDSERILEVLEMYILLASVAELYSTSSHRVDTQGLLDRISPLPSEHASSLNSSAGPSSGTQSHSFRALLKSSSNFPLRVLRVRSVSLST
jgi:hypothetical protein